MQSRHKDEIERMHRDPPPEKRVSVRLLLPLSQQKDTNQVGVPHTDGISNADFAHKKAIHPTKCKLHKFDVFGLKMSIKSGWNERNNQSKHRSYDIPKLRLNSYRLSAQQALPYV